MPLKEVRNGALNAGVLQQGIQKLASVRAHSNFAGCTTASLAADSGALDCEWGNRQTQYVPRVGNVVKTLPLGSACPCLCHRGRNAHA